MIHDLAWRVVVERPQDTKIACSLTDAALRERRRTVREQLLPHLIDNQRLATSLRLILPDTPPLRSTLERFVALERQCCQFLTFSVTVSAGEVVLTIAGPAEAQPVIDMFAGFMTGEPGAHVG